MTFMRLLLCALILSAGYNVALSETDIQDAAVLQSLKNQWKNTPRSWNSSDPCGLWEGVTCTNSRVTSLGLSSMGLSGQLSSDIGALTELTSFDLSFNKNFTGLFPPQLGNLQKLKILILSGCGFSGDVPRELGSLKDLSFLALNSNSFTGEIPYSLGNLTQLYWLDLADNQLTGSIPVSTTTTPGLDLLKNVKHIHLNKNKLSGEIPEKLFSSDMILLHLLLDGNQLSGEIPLSLGLVKTLEVLRLDRNALTGLVPTLNSLTNLIELNLAHNKLSGPLPDLYGLNYLNYVDLSNNFFQQSQAPAWFTNLQSLTTLVYEYGSLEGPVPKELFSLPQLQAVKLRNNAFDTLIVGSNISQQLQLVDLQNNEISSLSLNSAYNSTFILAGNPICRLGSVNSTFCQLPGQSAKPCSTSLTNCGNKTCASNQKLNPHSCACAYPYEGTIYFRGPTFRELSNCKPFRSLEMSLYAELGLTTGSVSLQNPFFNVDDYLQVELALFPSSGAYFNNSEIHRIGFAMSSHTFKPPAEFGPYYFIAAPYSVPKAVVH